MRTLRTVGVVVGLGALLLGLGPAPASTAADDQLEAGFAVRSILPDPEIYDEVWHTGRRRPTGVLDGNWARAVVLEQGDRRLGIVALDLLGLFYDDVVEIREAVRAELGAGTQVIVASTHSHATVDTLGIYGPDEVTSGLHEEYQEFVRTQAAEAVIAAADAVEPVRARFASRQAPDGLNEYDINRYPGSFDDGVNAISFERTDGSAVGTLVNWASHPELVDPRSSSDPDIPEGIRGAILSSDYVHTLRETVEGGGGGTAVFVNGPVGAVTGLAMQPTDPATGEVFTERRSVAKAYHVGRTVGATALEALGDGFVVDNPQLEVDSVVFDLRIDNPFLLALKATGVVGRATYEAGVEVPLGRHVRTEMVRVGLGPAEFLTVPGELHPDVYTGGYLPRSERANPDVPRERAIRPQMSGEIRFLIGLGQDELGYFVSATDFVGPSTVFPVYGRGVDRNGRSHYQETLSLGRDTARTIGQFASLLLGQEPEADYVAYPGGFLDADGVPSYRGDHSGDVRGIWIDTSGSGRYEFGGDAQVVTPLPAGVPAAYGFLDARGRDMGASPSTAARGVWADGDGDGAFDPLRDPHLFFDSYHVGKGEIP